MAYLGNYPALGIFGTGNIQDLAVTPAKLSTGAPKWDAAGNVSVNSASIPPSIFPTNNINNGFFGSLGGPNDHVFMSANAYPAVNGDEGLTTWRYWKSGAAARYDSREGIHRWFVAGAGSAGANISFSQVATINNAGNFGLGVTPSAWSGYRGLQVGYASVADTIGGNNALFGSNVFYDGSNFKYITGTTSTLYRQLAGEHLWYTASSGTAGGNISFTQRASLSQSGQMVIGSGSPGTNARLTVEGNITIGTSSIGNNANDFMTVGGVSVQQYGLTTAASPSVPVILSGFYGIGLYAGGVERVKIDTALRLSTTQPRQTVRRFPFINVGTQTSTYTSPERPVQGWKYVGQVNASNETVSPSRYIDILFNKQSESAMCHFWLNGYMYNYGIMNVMHGLYMYTGGNILNKFTYNNAGTPTVYNSYKNGAGYLALKIDLGSTDYTSAMIDIYFREFNDLDFTESIEITNVGRSNSTSNFF